MGLRTGEAVRLKRENFNKNFSVMIFQTLKGLKTKERILPEFLRKELARYYMSWNKRCKDGYLFFASYKNNSKNMHIKGSSIRIRFSQIRRKLGLTQIYYRKKDGKLLYRVSPHTLRHYAIWRYYKASGNCVITARDIIGHVKVETTARYIRSLDAINNEKNIVEKAFV